MSSGTVLITGGAGYIGAHVNKYLFEKGYKTIVLDNLERGWRDLVQWGDFIEGSVGDTLLLDDIFSRYRITDVVHLAAFAYVGESVEKPLSYWANNFNESLALVEQCVKRGVKRLVFSSTCATYGQPDSIPIDEEHRQSPISPYGASKLAVEWMIRDVSVVTGLKYFILRYFNAAGADPEGQIGERHIPETHIVPLALRAAHTSPSKVTMFGTDYSTADGTGVRDYVHVTDLADAHVRALEHLAGGGASESCNLGSGQGFSVGEVIDSVERVTGKRLQRIPKPRRVGDSPVLIADIRKAQKILDWKPRYTDVDSIISTAWHWHQRDWNE